ncbi:MAG: hypothetical protein LBH87_03335 [Coriobacteriales bacterium]|nr:hypothetical protein [Coriobacteriales bacterium]
MAMLALVYVANNSCSYGQKRPTAATLQEMWGSSGVVSRSVAGGVVGLTG